QREGQLQGYRREREQERRADRSPEALVLGHGGEVVETDPAQVGRQHVVIGEGQRGRCGDRDQREREETEEPGGNEQIARQVSTPGTPSRGRRGGGRLLSGYCNLAASADRHAVHNPEGCRWKLTTRRSVQTPPCGIGRRRVLVAPV